MAISSDFKKKYGKVAVLFGGTSAEREVSLDSGNGVLSALLSSGVDAVAVDPKDGLINQLSQQKFDRVFLVLHGGAGENGQVQAVLEELKLPYTGSGMLSSAINMDKLIAKALFAQAGLPVLPQFEMTNINQVDQVAKQFDFPVAVKPTNEGSSVGVSKVKSLQELAPAFELAKNYSDIVIVEPWLNGKELSLPVIEGKTFPIVDIQTPNREFYDYVAKTGDKNTVFVCPCEGLNAEQISEIESVALKAYYLTHCKGLARVDFRLDDSGKAWLFEINTTPGMTSCSLSPLSTSTAGMSYEQLVLTILDQTLSN